MLNYSVAELRIYKSAAKIFFSKLSPNLEAYHQDEKFLQFYT